MPGFEGSTPVRIGNGAHSQFQLDVFGEVLDAFYEGRKVLVDEQPETWEVVRALVDVVAQRWSDPDDGIWEFRGERRQFTHSKVMAWVAMDRAIRIVEEEGASLDVDAELLDRWKSVRHDIRQEVLEHGVDSRGVFVQEFDGTALDASLLLVPLVGFLPADDPRVVKTVAAIQEELTDDGFVRRYDPEATDDGVGGAEGTFLMCTFWLADNLILQGRIPEATAIFERLCGLRNDVGLLSEMYDPTAKRMLGNFPQAFSHTALVATGMALSRQADPDTPTWRRG